MRIRDFDKTGYYARKTDEQPPTEPGQQPKTAVAFHSVHIVGIAPIFMPELTGFVYLPLADDNNGGVDLLAPNVLLGNEDDWQFLCDASEPDFGPHTVLMKLIQLSGRDEADARTIARDMLVKTLDRQIYGTA